ncbi:CLUMA_CG000338, isoform A [Clunio marinus]|uniref:CLUMA_CG000338, isoform A n=1 Tax=Clunio marinus TaxID=568069 RepID=A0A1J1HF31_9DIPT|nr:CLUMA_CG000338, isoform A [Clunio marinus]
MVQIYPGLQRLVFENLLNADKLRSIISSNKLPVEISQHLGLVAHNSNSMQQQVFSQSASLLNSNYQSDHVTNIHHFHGINFNYAGNYQGNEIVSLNSPNLQTSPMHQITRGISVLTTSCSANEPLDLTMDSSTVTEMDTQWSGNFYDIRPINLSATASTQPQSQQTPQRIIAPTPPTSPSNNLCIIQEELLPAQYSLSHVDVTAQHLHHPQISLTDVQGSEITLVALSDSSRDSDDSLDTNNSNDTSRRTASTVTTPGTTSNSRGISIFHEFLIKEPSEDMPSITRGVGRKASLENETNKQMSCSIPSSVKGDNDHYVRRGSDKSLGFSDDSLSNDSNQSPAQEVSHSSGFKKLKICERQIGNEKAGSSSMDQQSVGSKGIIKLRRISGDQNEYGKLCQQLLTQLTV